MTRAAAGKVTSTDVLFNLNPCIGTYVPGGAEFSWSRRRCSRGVPFQVLHVRREPQQVGQVLLYQPRLELQVLHVRPPKVNIHAGTKIRDNATILHSVQFSQQLPPSLTASTEPRVPRLLEEPSVYLSAQEHICFPSVY